MSATVRLFASAGSTAFPVASNNQQQVTSSRFMIKQPYLARQTISATSGPAVTSDAALSASQFVKCLWIQIQPGRRVHYEVWGPNADARVADTSSPVLEGGEDFIEFWTGGKISLLECTETSA